MRKHPIRKFFGLTILYAVIIIGIFILQFKTESVISQNIGSLRISLAQVEQEDNKTELRNQLQVNFNGVGFTATDSTPAIVSNSNISGSEKNLVLKSWSKPTDLSAEFLFTDGSSITFTVSDKTSKASLTILAEPSKGNDTLTLVYRPEGGYTIKEQMSNKIYISSKNSNFALNAPHIASDRIAFSSNNLIATYNSYDPTKHFSFDSIIGLSLTDSKTFDSTVKQVKAELITKFNQMVASADSNSLSEQDVISYVAEMAINGRFDEALDNVPDSFKKGNKRTYISSPYFDNMVNMNKSLVMQLDKLNSMEQSALDSKNLDIFCVENIDNFIIMQKRTSKIKSLLSMPSTIENFTPTVSQATGIISVYTKLFKSDSALASLFDSVLEKCIDKIEASCSVENEIMTISEDSTPVSIEQRILTGTAFVNYGKLRSDETLVQAGYLLVNSAVSSTDTLQLQTLSKIYPYIVQNNNYYPHADIFGYYGQTPVWAWTCASAISYAKESDGTIDINITFPLGETHYVIFNGVPTFHANIEIQKQRFRTDPRFETYNSSGYVYNEDTQTLFIKSRHKSQVELIRLFCDKENTFVLASSASASTVVAETKPATLPAQTTSSNKENAVSVKPSAANTTNTTSEKTTSAANTTSTPVANSTASKTQSASSVEKTTSTETKEESSAASTETTETTAESTESEKTESTSLNTETEKDEDSSATATDTTATDTKTTTKKRTRTTSTVPHGPNSN